MNVIQMILVIKRIIKILIDSGILDKMDTARLADVQEFAALDTDPERMKGWGLADIIEMLKILAPVLEQIWEVIQREDEPTVR